MKAPWHWSFKRVLLSAVGWVVLNVVGVAGWLIFDISGSFAGSGSAGIGAVSVGISEAALAIPFGPPLVLIVVWLVMHRRGAV